MHGTKTSQATIVGKLYSALFLAYLDGAVLDVREILAGFDQPDTAVALTILNECVELGTVTKVSKSHYELAELDQKAFGTAHFNLRNDAYKQSRAAKPSNVVTRTVTWDSPLGDKYAYLASLPDDAARRRRMSDVFEVSGGAGVLSGCRTRRRYAGFSCTALRTYSSISRWTQLRGERPVRASLGRHSPIRVPARHQRRRRTLRRTHTMITKTSPAEHSLDIRTMTDIECATAFM